MSNVLEKFKQIFNLDELKGKVITKISHDDDEVIIHLENYEFFNLSAYTDYADEAAIELCDDSKYPFFDKSWIRSAEENFTGLHKLGFLTDDELVHFNNLAVQKYEKEREEEIANLREKEIAELKRLRDKYPDA